MSSSTSTPDVTTSSIKKLAIRGAVWTILGYGASQILRFGSNLILTRLLVPELFGLMSLIYVFITGLHMFSDTGVGISIVQNKRGDERAFLDTAWTIQVIRGVILWVACLLIAYPVAQIYHEPRLQWLLPLVGLSTIITGFMCTSIFTLNRHLSVKKLAIFEFSSQLAGTTVMIIWAYFSPSVWALVAGGLVTCVYQVTLSYRISQGKWNRFAWDKSAAQELFSFGIWIFLSTVITFFGEQADKLILGRLLDLTLLGIYGIAMTFADLPRSVTSAVSGRVIMPAFSRIADAPRSTIRAKLLRQRRKILLLLAPGLAIMVSCGDVIIKTLYDERYIAAAWMLPILALGIWPRLLCNTIESVLFSLAKPQYTAVANFTRFVCTAAGIWMGYSLFGLPGAVIGVALNDLCYYVVICYGLHREGISGIRQDVWATALLFGSLALLVGMRYLAGLGTPIDQLFV